MTPASNGGGEREVVGTPSVRLPFEPWPTSWPEWVTQYEETAKRLHDNGDPLAADDIATLVMGLVEYEREEAKRNGVFCGF